MGIQIYDSDDLKVAYKQGRSDAIEECIEMIINLMPAEPFLLKSEHHENWKMKTTELRMLIGMLEKMKEG